MAQSPLGYEAAPHPNAGEVWTLVVNASAGQYKLQIEVPGAVTVTTADIAYNAVAATVQAAVIAALPAKMGTAAVVGGVGAAGGGTPYFVTIPNGPTKVTAINGTTPLSGGAALATPTLTVASPNRGVNATVTNPTGATSLRGARARTAHNPNYPTSVGESVMVELSSPYSKSEHLLFDPAQLRLGQGFDLEKVVLQAGEDIDAKLGFIYKLPLTLRADATDGDGNPITAFPTREILLLKGINNKLASGRLFLGLRASADDTRQHAYGQQLVNEAMMELMCLANGDVMLSAELLGTGGQGVGDNTRGLAIRNHDDISLVDEFENVVYRGVKQTIMPGGPL